MREPTCSIAFLALALTLVASSFSAFGRGGERGGFEEREAPEEQTIRVPEERLRAPQERAIRAPEEQTPLRTQTFAGHAYHGQLAWRDGRWRQEVRDGRDGWWWDVGGYWYYYPQQTEGPPSYVSDVEVADDAAIATPSDSRSPPATSDSPSQPATSDSPSPPGKIWISPQ